MTTFVEYGTLRAPLGQSQEVRALDVNACLSQRLSQSRSAHPPGNRLGVRMLDKSGGAEAEEFALA